MRTLRALKNVQCSDVKSIKLEHMRGSYMGILVMRDLLILISVKGECRK